MSGNFQLNRMHVQQMDTYTVNVPDNDVAKLMYYLSCVDTVINFKNIDKLSDFRNYDSLSVEEMTGLFELVLLFNPKYFIEKGVFIIDRSLLPPNSSNTFYQITDERIGMHVSSEMLIGGRTVKVLKVMVCDENWLLRNYFTPWKNIFEMADQMERYRTVQVPAPPPPKVIFVPVEKERESEPPARKKKNDIGCGCILF